MCPNTTSTSGLTKRSVGSASSCCSNSISSTSSSSSISLVDTVVDSVGSSCSNMTRSSAISEVSVKSKRIASSITAVATFLIVTAAVRSCTPPGHWDHSQASLRSGGIRMEDGGVPIESVSLDGVREKSSARVLEKMENEGDSVDESEPSVMSAQELSDDAESVLLESNSPESGEKNETSNQQDSQTPKLESKYIETDAPTENVTLKQERRRLSEAEKIAPVSDGESSTYEDPRSVKLRTAAPLESNTYKLNPLVQPSGYPWHRWPYPSNDEKSSYPLNTTKFVNILARYGRGENQLGTVKPQQYTWGGVALPDDMPRMHGMVRPYIIRNGMVLRPNSKTGMWVTFVERAVKMAKELEEVESRMKLLEDLPLIYDPNDYPWCGDDLVPVFRLNAIKSEECMHSWPTMSLTYFSDPTNMQLAESPYKWDAVMKEWDEIYPWDQKLNKVVWRGRMTGYTYPDGERPRTKLVQFSKNLLDITDVKPTTERSKMPQDDFQKYKAILDIDGNAWSARLGKLLCYNSVVIKVEPSYVGYWESELKPWVHYIPVKEDFSDLEKTIRYVMAPENEEEMKQIVKHSQSFCRTKLTMEQYTVDLLWTLLAYAELVKGSPDFYEEWKKNDDAYLMPALNMGPYGRQI